MPRINSGDVGDVGSGTGFNSATTPVVSSPADHNPVVYYTNNQMSHNQARFNSSPSFPFHHHHYRSHSGDSRQQLARQPQLQQRRVILVPPPTPSSSSISPSPIGGIPRVLDQNYRITSTRLEQQEYDDDIRNMSQIPTTTAVLALKSSSSSTNRCRLQISIFFFIIIHLLLITASVLLLLYFFGPLSSHGSLSGSIDYGILSGTNMPSTKLIKWPKWDSFLHSSLSLQFDPLTTSRSSITLAIYAQEQPMIQPGKEISYQIDDPLRMLQFSEDEQYWTIVVNPGSVISMTMHYSIGSDATAGASNLAMDLVMGERAFNYWKDSPRDPSSLRIYTQNLAPDTTHFFTFRFYESGDTSYHQPNSFPIPNQQVLYVIIYYQDKVNRQQSIASGNVHFDVQFPNYDVTSGRASMTCPVNRYGDWCTIPDSTMKDGAYILISGTTMGIDTQTLSLNYHITPHYPKLIAIGASPVLFLIVLNCVLISKRVCCQRRKVNEAATLNEEGETAHLLSTAAQANHHNNNNHNTTAINNNLSDTGRYVSRADSPYEPTTTTTTTISDPIPFYHSNDTTAFYQYQQLQHSPYRQQRVFGPSPDVKSDEPVIYSRSLLYGGEEAVDEQ